MNKNVKRIFICFLCLLGLFFIPGFQQKTHAMMRMPARSHSGGPCFAGDPLNTGISYDAPGYTTVTVSPDVINTPQPVGIFSVPGSTVPAIGGWGCMGSNLLGIFIGNPGATYYNFRTTVNGVTTQSVQRDGFRYGGYVELQFLLNVDQQYIFQVQSCTRTLYQRLAHCSPWSATLHLTTAANSYCLNGYVWREAAAFDHVCVTPDQRDWVAYDNAVAADRVDPYGAYGPQTCVSGYVWRLAFGGDYACVTPNERSQVAYDNSLALTRIIAL